MHCRIIFFIIFIIIFSSCNRTPKQFELLDPENTGLFFTNEITETQYNNIMTYEYSYNGGGIAVGDINNDGLTDVYFSGNSVPNKLFINKGNLQFEDITQSSQTAGRKDWKTGVTMIDINADGWLDIYLCYSGNAPKEGYAKPIVRDFPGRSNELYINNGCEPGGVPTFTESAKEYGLDAPGTFSTQAYFFDYDLDGDLDMFLLNHANMFYSAFLNTRKLRNLRHPYFGNKIFRNNSSGVRESNQKENLPIFTEVSDLSGIHGSGLNYGLSASISDFNGDNYPDLYVTNDFEEQDFCYINNGDGTFKEVSKTLFGHLSKFSMGSDISDINNDGYQDILVLDMLPESNRRQKLLKGPDEYERYNLAVDSGYHHQNMRNTLQLNRGIAPDGLPRFSEIAQFSGLSNTDWSWAPLIADFDNDGLKDVFITNGFLRDFNNLDFIKYNSNVYNQAQASRRSIDYLSLIQQLPATKLSNYLFKNENGLKFINNTEAWGLEQPSVSNGAVYVDLDNDGDYDLITNNLNSPSFIYQNNQDLIQNNRFLKIKLQGSKLNIAGIGAKIFVSTADHNIFQEVYFGRGFQSGVDPVINIGVGKSEIIDEVKVIWPSSKESIVKNVRPDQLILISENEAQLNKNLQFTSHNRIIEEITDSSGLDFEHRENNFVDFKIQRLLHYQVSRLGGKFSVGDVNKDGNDDVFFGGAVGQSGELFLGNDNGTFRKSLHQPWSVDSLSEDLNSLFFDSDGDGDEDLYIVSGGSEFVSDAPLYQDKLYINDGKGSFKKAENALPNIVTSGSCVVAADYDKDGDYDLFVGGRHVPGNYGEIPESYILENISVNSEVKFKIRNLNHDPSLSEIGMVTSATWTDFNGDSWPDLIVVGEWMPVRLFENQKGKLVEVKDVPGLENTNGWWTSILSVDIDNDGDFDYLMGNAGTNLQFKASLDEPVQLYTGDFNNDGLIDPILNFYINGKSYPFATRDELLDQIAPLRKKFKNYEDYADAAINDIATSEQLENTEIFNAYTFHSGWLENINANDFKLHKFPEEAQLSNINGFIIDDFTGDGKKEIIAAGNFYAYKPQLGKSDASEGILLKFNNGFTANGLLSELWLGGDIRDLKILKFKSGVKRIVVSRNNDKVSVYSYGTNNLVTNQ